MEIPNIDITIVFNINHILLNKLNLLKILIIIVKKVILTKKCFIKYKKSKNFDCIPGLIEFNPLILLINSALVYFCKFIFFYSFFFFINFAFLYFFKFFFFFFFFLIIL